ncbi:MAG: hypothetical protein LUD80_02515, partial [Clostridiales bacterium]|nr:hypothetical protein [Clostridiales bacterium]
FITMDILFTIAVSFYNAPKKYFCKGIAPPDGRSHLAALLSAHSLFLQRIKNPFCHAEYDFRTLKKF